jgi:Schlafen, AlbA_2
MGSIFDVDLSELEPEHVEEFLRDVSGEGLTWEGKGTAPLTQLKSKIVAGVCGLANQLGGYFIVGAEEDKDAGTWTLVGVENDCREDPHDWLARILRGNLVDAPPFEVRSWRLAGNRVAAVIRVDQTAIPPCMTKDGLVYVRVVSETVKAKDPRMLADLLRKGEAARKNAEDKAVATLSLLIEGGALVGEEIDRFVLALAPTTVGIDYTGRIFTGSFKESLLVAATELEQSFVDERRDSVVEMHRDGYRVLRGSPDRPRWFHHAENRAIWNEPSAFGVRCLVPIERGARDPFRHRGYDRHHQGSRSNHSHDGFAGDLLPRYFSHHQGGHGIEANERRGCRTNRRDPLSPRAILRSRALLRRFGARPAGGGEAPEGVREFDPAAGPL